MPTTAGCLHSRELPAACCHPLAALQLLWHSINWTVWRIRCALSAPHSSIVCASRSLSPPACIESQSQSQHSIPEQASSSILEHPRAAPGRHSCLQCLCKFIYAKETQSSTGFGCNLLTTRVTAPRQRHCCHAVAYVQRVLHADELVSLVASATPSAHWQTKLTLSCLSSASRTLLEYL